MQVRENCQPERPMLAAYRLALPFRVSLPSQAECLTDAGCRFAQGCGYAAPMEVTALREFLMAGRH